MTRTYALPRGVEAPALARRLCAATCREWGFEQRLGHCQLLVSELVTNAVVHGAGSISMELRSRTGEILRVTIVGSRFAVPVPRDPAPLATWGRGLQIVAALADQWGSESAAGGTDVWFELWIK